MTPRQHPAAWGRILIEEHTDMQRLEALFGKFREEHPGASLPSLLSRREDLLMIPAEAFKGNLSPLETVVWYLSSFCSMGQTAIAKTLGRDHTTIWTTLHNIAGKKQKLALSTLHLIPLTFLHKKKLSILESVALYLMEEHQLNYHEIAQILGRDDRTIWTVVHRARKKLEHLPG